MIIRYHILIKTIGTLLISMSISAQSFITLPEDSVSFGLFVVDYQSKIFEQGTILNYPPCLEIDTVMFPLDLETQPAMDYGYTIMTYPCTGDTVFHGTYIWLGQGEIIKPENFLPADSFYVQEDLIQQPTSIQYWRENGLPLLDSGEIQAADSAWNAIKNLNVVHQFAHYSYQVILYRYPPTLGMFDPSVAKWIVFLYRNPASPIVTYDSPAFSLSFNNSDYDFPIVVDTQPRTYRINSEIMGLVGENAPTEWTFSSIHQSENTLSFFFDDFVFGPEDTINWSDTSSYSLESVDQSDFILQEWSFFHVGSPLFFDVNTGNPSGFIIRTNNSPQQLTSEDTLSFAINGHARSDLTKFYPLALGNKWKWTGTPHYIDSVRTEEVVAVNVLADFSEYVIERRGHDFQLYGGLITLDTIYKYTHALDRAHIYSASFLDAVDISFSDSNSDEEIEFFYQLIDDSPELVLRKYSYFGSSTWQHGVGLLSEFMDPGAVKTLVGYQIDGVEWGNLNPIQVSISEHKYSPTSLNLIAYPNPFNPSSTIIYSLPIASNVKLRVFNISGQTVQVLVDANQDAGTYKVQWNGMDQSNRQVSAGMYFIQLLGENYSQVLKVVYL